MQSSSSVLKNSCETSQSDIVIQLASNNLAIGFSSNSIAVRLKNPGCKIVPLEVTLSRPIYYVTHKDMLNYPTVHSFTDFIKDRFQPDKQYRKMTCGFLSSPVIINRRESIFGGLL